MRIQEVEIILLKFWRCGPPHHRPDTEAGHDLGSEVILSNYTAKKFSDGNTTEKESRNYWNYSVMSIVKLLVSCLLDPAGIMMSCWKQPSGWWSLSCSLCVFDLVFAKSGSYIRRSTGLGPSSCSAFKVTLNLYTKFALLSPTSLELHGSK